MTMIECDAERVARASLTYLAEPTDERLNALVMACGSAAGALAAVKDGKFPSALTRTGSSRAAAEKSLEKWRVRLGELPEPRDLEEFCRRGIRLVCPGDPEWPSRLDELGPARPYALWVRGSADLRFSCVRSVAVVGSRAATAYGSYVAAEISSSVAARGWTIVSGAAYGVDAAAHRGALGASGTTVAVLACGVDQPYPAGHADLLDAIAGAGAVVSEWPPGRNATRLRFLVRNRVIAALSTGTVVVEAGERSGALNTGRHARDLGRELMAVPGPVTSQQSAGCHTIIRDWNGTLVTSATDVLEMVTPLGESGPGHDTAGTGTGPTGPGPTGRPALTAVPGGVSRRAAAAAPPLLSRDALDLESSAVLDALPVRGGLGTTAVAARAGLAPTTVLKCLGELAAGGFAERCEAGWRIRRI